MSETLEHETLEHRETTIEGVRLHWVRAAGPGTPVVLLHGWPQTWYAWRKVIPELEADASIPLCTPPDHQRVIWKI
ncbi:alpha/beta fold hydrolase [Streptomyces asiaticus]